MADFHAADLWVAVVPETSQVGPAMEKAGKEAKGKFGDAVKGIGKNIHDEFEHIGQKAKDSFGKAGKNAGTAFNSEIVREVRQTLGDELGSAIGDKIEAPITNQLKKVAGEHWGEVIGRELSQGIGGQLGNWISGTKHGVDEAKASFAQLKNGELSGVQTALDNIDKRAKDFGVDVTGWTGPLHEVAGGPLQEVQNRTKDIRTSAHDFLDVFKELPGKIGASAGALAALVDGPLAAAVAAAMTLDHALHIDSNTFDPGQHGWGHVLFGKTWDWFGGGDPNTGLDKHLTQPSAPAPPPGVPFTPQTLLGGPTPGGSAPKSLNDLLFPGATKSTPNTTSPWANNPWFGVAKAESGGNPKTNTGNGYYGALQFDQNTWNDFGGQDFAPRPDLASLDQQFAVADRVPVSQRAGRWPNTYKNFGAGGGPSAISASGLNLDTIPVAAQKYANDCIDASARIILSHSGVNMSEDQLMSVIAPGGTIDSQAAGLNRLFPAGAFKAMQGSGGSPQAMFAAIKASIDRGVGSILNVAPGSSIAGHNFSDGHFIAATGYNPDGTINLSDTARGTKYSVSAADAFQATRGRGIVTGTGSGPGATSGGVSGQIPTGAEHDPLYVTSTGPGGQSSGSPFENQGQQLGQGLLGGIMQSLGLDGSVFGGKSPLDWGAVKLGGGLLNYGMGLAKSMSGPMGTPGLGAGGGGGLGGLAGLIPGPGAAISAAAAPGGGSYGMGQQGVGNQTNLSHDQSITINANGGDPYKWLQETQWYRNSMGSNPPGSSGRTNFSPVPVGPGG